MASGPSRIYLIRHAEKLGVADVSDDAGDPNAKHTGPHLSARGSGRAAALASLFTPVTKELTCALETKGNGYAVTYERIGYAGMAPRFVAPDVVFAARSAKHSSRSVATVTPLAASLRLDIDTSFGVGEEPALVDALLSKHSGKVALVCWHHTQLTSLARLLGAAEAPVWPGTVFDRLWLIDRGRQPVVLTDCPQALMFGDRAS